MVTADTRTAALRRALLPLLLPRRAGTVMGVTRTVAVAARALSSRWRWR
jgi:hypothetical protein